ncbi:MAG TPA: ArsC/Spx/MgsR family protein, partial [Candidatus Dormibacteraeota bacterium]|nr:ArsC/Spx/MgsR family protein [Candidatus Dormibacteraeota bacterium]
MLELGAEIESRDLDKTPLSVAEIESLIGDRDYKLFLNTRNELYREKKMTEKPPSRAEAIVLMSKNPNLIKRPILSRGGRLLLGFDEAAYRRFLK